MNNNISQTFDSIKDFAETVSKMEKLLEAYLPHIYRGTLRNCALTYTYLISKQGAYSKSFLRERLHLTEIQYVNVVKKLAKAGFISNLNNTKACRYTRWVAVYRKDFEDEGLDCLWAAAQMIQNDTWNTFEKICISSYSCSYKTLDQVDSLTEEELVYHVARVSDEEINVRHQILYKITVLNKLKNIAIGLVYRRYYHKRGVPATVRLSNNSTSFEMSIGKLFNQIYSNPVDANPRDIIKGLVRSIDSCLNPLYDQLNAYEEARA